MTTPRSAYRLTFEFESAARLHAFDCMVLLERVEQALLAEPVIGGRFDAKLVPADGLSGMAEMHGTHAGHAVVDATPEEE
jgi:hypothetical protein